MDYVQHFDESSGSADQDVAMRLLRDRLAQVNLGGPPDRLTLEDWAKTYL